MDALAADAFVLGNFCQRKVLVVVQVKIVTLLLCEQFTIVVEQERHIQRVGFHHPSRPFKVIHLTA